MGKWCLLIFIVFLTGCDIPKDPENSWSEAQKEHLIIGIAENPPYINYKNDSVWGSEITLIQNFASAHDLRIKFIKGSESELIKKIEDYQIHFMLAGLDKKSLWTKKAGASLPYDGSHVILIPKGENKLLQNLELFLLEK
ncbi:transporter substrate-binding domain-containing protein [Salegentibacter sp. F14]